LWSAVTGLALEAADLRRAAAAHWQRKRTINARLGWTPADDALPARLFEPLPDGPLAGARVDAARLARMQALYESLRAGASVPA
jgi:aldehyde:ferredoxin oxidoreductase